MIKIDGQIDDGWGGMLIDGITRGRWIDKVDRQVGRLTAAKNAHAFTRPLGIP